MEIEVLSEDILKCPQCELSTLGTFFKNPSWYFTYSDLLKNADFSDPNTRFWHVFLTDYLLTYSNEVSPALLNTFASMNNTRLSGYKKFGGFTTVKSMMELALDEGGLLNSIQTLKKYSLVRGLAKDGFGVENIIGHSQFNSMDAEDVAALVQGKLDTICNNSIINVNQSSDLAKNSGDFVDSFFKTPSMGLSTPFNFLNDYTLGLCQGDSLFWGSISNAGKGRSLLNVACYLTLVNGARVSMLANEMDLQRMKQAFLVTACNAGYAQQLTGCDLHIPEKRIVLASYLDDSTGNPIYRYYNKDGEYTETTEQYKQRVMKSSSEYQKVKEVTRYLEQHTLDKMMFKNIASNYSDSALLRHVNQSVLVEGADVVIYDTIKNAPSTSGISKLGDWAALLNTATILQETIAKLKTASAIFSFQLDRSSYKKRIEELNEDNIASSAGMLTIADQMVMFRHISKADYKDYRIIQKCDEWGAGETSETELDINKSYTGFRIMKNRRGSRGSIFVTETNLDLNTWNEIDGTLMVKNMRSASAYSK